MVWGASRNSVFGHSEGPWGPPPSVRWSTLRGVGQLPLIALVEVVDAS